MKISIIIPAWNEEKTIETLVEKVVFLEFNGLSKEIICINDASTDSTLKILTHLKKKRGIKLINNEKNLGKSRSVRKGILESTGDIVVVQDADLELEPKDLVPMAELIRTGQADAVFGNRYSQKKINQVSISNQIGNRGLTFLSNCFTIFHGLVIPDMEVCYKMLRGDVMRDIGQKITATSNIGIEPEMTAKVAKYRLNGKKLRVQFYPIWYFPRTVAEGKTVKYFSDGWRAFKEIVRFNLFK